MKNCVSHAEEILFLGRILTWVIILHRKFRRFEVCTTAADPAPPLRMFLYDAVG